MFDARADCARFVLLCLSRLSLIDPFAYVVVFLRVFCFVMFCLVLLGLVGTTPSGPSRLPTNVARSYATSPL